MLVLDGLVVFHRTVQLQLFNITGQGIDLDYCDFEWFALERTEIILSFLRLHMLLEISGEISTERMKGGSQSKNNTELWM